MDAKTIEKYSPDNAANLTTEEVLAMKNFTDADLKALADAYPNGPGITSGYLILGNKNAKVQAGNLSTWKTLYNLRVRNKKVEFYALSFRSLWKKQTTAQPSKAPVVDLTNKEAKQAPGISEPQTAKLKSEEGANEPPVIPISKIDASEILNAGNSDIKKQPEFFEPDLSEDVKKHNEKMNTGKSKDKDKV